MDYTDMEKSACPSCGSCSGMYTANSMNCLTEAIGLALPGNGSIPAVMSARTALAKQAGERIMELLKMVVPAILPAVFSCYFDIFDGLIQAYVFVFLTALFVKEATE